MALVADANGRVTGSFAIPANVPAGSKLVEFIGSGGSKGQAQYVGQGKRVSTVFRRVYTRSWWRYDPLAQTFTLDSAQQISAVDLWFTAKGTSTIIVQIRETTNGFPSQNILAEGRLDPAVDITSLTSHTQVNFAQPISLLPNVEYAIVIMCNDAVTALSVAQLGKFDANVQQWVTAQAYQVGVLLSSSNASTWTAHQDRDLTFRLHRAMYSETVATIDLGIVPVVAATDLMLLTTDDVPDSNSHVEYDLTLPDTSIITVTDGQPVQLDAPITGDVGISARVTGNVNGSPVLYPGFQLISSVTEPTGTYISRSIKAGTGVTIKVIFDALLPGGSTVTTEYRLDGGVWASVPFVSSSPVDNGFLEMVSEAAGLTGVNAQIRLTLNGGATGRPIIQNLRFMTV